MQHSTVNAIQKNVLMASFACFSLSVASLAVAQKSVGEQYSAGGSANLDLRLSDGEARGYAFIKQDLRDGNLPEVHVHLRRDQSWLPEDEWTWYVSDPSDNNLKHDLALPWYGQASCPDDLTKLEIDGPGGSKTQSPLTNPIAGYFEYQSFTVDTVKNVCITWATENNCDPIEPGCQVGETFELVGGVAPATNDDLIILKASCAAGALPTENYAPVVKLSCHRGDY